MKRIFIFMWYILTQPFIETLGLMRAIFEKGKALNYPRTWQYVFLVLTLLFYLSKNRFMTNIFGILLIITIIKSEWDSGKFMERWRKRLERRAERTIEEQKPKVSQDTHHEVTQGEKNE